MPISIGASSYCRVSTLVMERRPEPELMVGDEQARAYARADFSVPHQQFILEFRALHGGELDGPVLDLGCGTADITRRFALAYPAVHLYGVDGSEVMLAWAERLNREAQLTERIELQHGTLPGVSLPARRYMAIISNSLLHHLADPQVLWQTILEQSSTGCRILVMDLRRPESVLRVRELVAQYAAEEAEILQCDFYSSLLAAFTTAEVESQLKSAGLSGLNVRAIGDRHLTVTGVL